MAMQPKSILKFISIIVGFILIIFILKGALAPSKPAKAGQSTKTGLQAEADTASPDTMNESLKALSAQIQQVSDQNKEIVARDKKIQEDNAQNVANLQQAIQSRLSQIDQKNQQTQEIQTAALKQKMNAPQYPLGGTSGAALSVSSNAGNTNLTWVDDMQNSLLPAGAIPQNANLLLTSKHETLPANTNASAAFSFQPKNDKDAAKPIPRYTIPANSVLANTTTMTGLIGRIPINGIVRDPYSFLLIVGPENLAANSTYMPDVAKVMVSGTATGDMALSCVRGAITSLTFVFQDGTISTINANANGSQSSSLGYLTSSNGNPCITGHFYTNAPEFLTGNVLLGAAQGAAGAYAAEQTTSTTNIFGGSTSSVTGSPTKYVLGQAGMNAANQAQQWWNAREQNSFDAVYVAPDTDISVVINQEIPIDYNPEGRKVAYDFTQTNPVSRHLD